MQGYHHKTDFQNNQRTPIRKLKIKTKQTEKKIDKKGKSKQIQTDDTNQ